MTSRSPSGSFMRPSASSKILRARTLSASRSASSSPSPSPTPSSTSSPGPIAATSSASTDTDALVTRCTSARMGETKSIATCEHIARSAEAPGRAPGSSAPCQQPLAIDPVVAPLGAQVGRDRQMAAGPVLAAGLRERATETEVREVVHRVALDDRLELLGRLRVAAAAKVGPPERLPDRGLVGIEAGRPAKWDPGLLG